MGEDQCYEVLCRVGVCCTDNSMYVWRVQIEYTVWVKTSATRCCAESECVVLTTVCMCGMYRSCCTDNSMYVWHVQIVLY